MPKARKIIAKLLGGIQCGVGGVISVFAYLIYASPSIQNTLTVAPQEVYLYMFLFLVFGIFSILSGLLLINENRGN